MGYNDSMSRSYILYLLFLFIACLPADAFAAGNDPFTQVFGVLALVVLAAVVGRFLAQRFGQSAVLGELVIGMVIGTIIYSMNAPAFLLIRHFDVVEQIVPYAFSHDLEWASAVTSALEQASLPAEVKKRLQEVFLSRDFPAYYYLARTELLFSSLGVLLLLFMVGLESSVRDMRTVGSSAFGVAIIGVVAPFGLGFGVSMLMFPGHGALNIAIFLGATLCATSIGITARVFRDMGALGLHEAKIVLGAAVIDDVLGLIILAVVTGIISTGSVQFGSVALIVAKSLVFLAAVIIFGSMLARHNVRFFSLLDRRGARLLYPFALLMVLSWMADQIGLAAIIGAFAAGLIIEEEHFEEAGCQDGHHDSVESIIAPIEAVFAPVFFVLMGMQVDVMTLADVRVLGAGLALSAVAVAGKVAGSVVLPKDVDRLIVGIGMVPRGEVGLIFAGVGKTIGILSNELFSVIIIMVLLTTLVTPPALAWAVRRKAANKSQISIP